jgi:uncharacterized protein YndB with AHSA1/START domain
MCNPEVAHCEMIGGREDAVTRDTIEREIVLPAPIDRVWTAITDPAEVSQWFGTETRIDLRPGGAAIFGWPEESGVFHAVVVEVDPPHRFSYRWAFNADTPVDAGPSTLVEFTLVEVAEGTKLRVVDSGFAAFPEELREGAVSGNAEGWTEELADLARHLGATVGI